MEPTFNKVENEEECTNQNEFFKKPILIGKIGKLPKKNDISTLEISKTIPEITIKIPEPETNDIIEEQDTVKGAPAQKEDPSVTFSYIEPSWSGLPATKMDYIFEVLKSGVIIEKINLMDKPFWVFGRLTTADICMAHPTVSRHHAVVQYKSEDSDTMPSGYYIYDLGSTHGTFLNKNRIKPKMYVRIQVGHLLRIGCSTRTLVLTGPEDDIEEESELSVSELKQKRAEDLRLKQEEELTEKKKLEQEMEERKKKEEEKGVDWGMGEDADEETDVSENPYAETSNEHLYIEDPKKALRGFMEREGLELNYDCTEQGMGQFLCRVTLPLDDIRGKPIIAEALVKGKKKEAVVQCALEACRILDRHGVLRQATHESRKRKAKNWEDNDFYDSDEDTFLDRTGTIERKREKRMQAKIQQQPETYQSLCEKEEKLSDQITNIEKQLNQRLQSTSLENKSNDDADSLDSFMCKLNENKPDKYMMAKLKAELVRLKMEHAKIVKLINIARPAHLPPLQLSLDNTVQPSSSKGVVKKQLPIFGKRLKIKVNFPSRTETSVSKNDDDIEEDEEEEELKEEEDEMKEVENKNKKTENKEPAQPNQPEIEDNTPKAEQQLQKINFTEKFMSVLDDSVKAKISKTVTKLRKIAEEEESIIVEEKRLAIQKRKIIKLVNSTSDLDVGKQTKLSNALNRMTDEYFVIGNRKMKMVEKINKLADDINNIAIEIKMVSKAHHEEAVMKMKSFVEKAQNQQKKIFEELQKLGTSIADFQVMEKLKELHDWLNDQKNGMTENLEKLKNIKITQDYEVFDEIMQYESKSEMFISTILEEIQNIRNRPINVHTDAEIPGNSRSETNSESPITFEDQATSEKKKKNLRRVRHEKTKIENKKQHEDVFKEDHDMWIPPEDQTGDGRTNLNEKFGY